MYFMVHTNTKLGFTLSPTVAGFTTYNCRHIIFSRVKTAVWYRLKSKIKLLLLQSKRVVKSNESFIKLINSLEQTPWWWWRAYKEGKLCTQEITLVKNYNFSSFRKKGELRIYWIEKANSVSVYLPMTLPLLVALLYSLSSLKTWKTKKSSRYDWWERQSWKVHRLQLPVALSITII